jgi:hypothetical protein
MCSLGLLKRMKIRQRTPQTDLSRRRIDEIKRQAERPASLPVA